MGAVRAIIFIRKNAEANSCMMSIDSFQQQHVRHCTVTVLAQDAYNNIIRLLINYLVEVVGMPTA